MAMLPSLELGRSRHLDCRISYLKESQPEPGKGETGARLLEEGNIMVSHVVKNDRI